jgi:hypothetical protein
VSAVVRRDRRHLRAGLDGEHGDATGGQQSRRLAGAGADLQGGGRLPRGRRPLDEVVDERVGIGRACGLVELRHLAEDESSGWLLAHRSSVT